MVKGIYNLNPLFLFSNLLYNIVTGDFMNDLFNKLDNIILKYDRVVIMGHKDPDLDSYGTSLALYTRIKSLGKDCYIYLDGNNYSNLIKRAMCKVEGINYINLASEVDFSKMLLIVVDVHQKNRLEDPDILDKINDVVILDHHIKGKKFIDNTKLFYIDSNLSSMIELMTYYLEYSRVNVNEIIATIMLAALEIDTNNYNLKTTSKTYKAASMLVEFGADITSKQELLKESKEDFIKRADYIKNSYIVNNNVAICVLPEVSKREVLAEVADELLNFDDVFKSFAIAKLENNEIGVSARSLNNCEILSVIKKLGGGGSNTNAATTTNKTIKEIKNIITKLTR